MRKTFLYCFLGLVSVGSIAGCGVFRHAREERCADSGRCSQRITARNGATRPSTPSETIQTTHLQVGVSWWGKNLAWQLSPEDVVSGKNSTSNLPKVTDAAPHLPQTAQTSERVDLPAIEVLVEEDAIVNREATAKKNVTIVADETPWAEPIVVVPGVTIPMVKEPTPTREKTIAIKTVDIQYGQVENFAKVTGQVQQFRKSWRLRYADVAQEDPYGGVVVLDGGPELSQLRDGQHVRVTGVLVSPATRTSSANYRVKAIEILD